MEQPILDKLSDAGIFSVTKENSGSFTLTEECDRYFTVSLTPAELMQLTVELRQLLND